jgi:preprotein translocase subunit SecG
MYLVQILLMSLIVITSIFLILIVLIQRGRGGGLAGAFGGLGGASAFGTKAGDTFTWITVYTAAFWIVLCAVAVKMLGSPQSIVDPTLGTTGTSQRAPAAAGGESREKRDATGGARLPTGTSDGKAVTPEPTSPPARQQAAPPTDAPAPDDGK